MPFIALQCRENLCAFGRGQNLLGSGSQAFLRKYAFFTAVAAFNSHFCPTKDKILKKRTKYPRPVQIRGNERVCDELGIATSSSDVYVGSPYAGDSWLTSHLTCQKRKKEFRKTNHHPLVIPKKGRRGKN